MSNDIFQGYKGKALEVLKKFNIRVWSHTQIKTNRGNFEGTVLPRSENDDDTHIVLKIATGYNVGVDIHTIENMKELGYKKPTTKFPKRNFLIQRTCLKSNCLGQGAPLHPGSIIGRVR